MDGNQAHMSIKRQFFWNVIPLVALTVVNLVSLPLFLRFLGEDMYALWFYVSTFSGVFGFADLGLGVAVGRYVGIALGKGDTASVREYWGTGNAFAIPLLAVMALIYIIAGVWLGPHWFNVAEENKALLCWCFAVAGVTLFFTYYGQMWNILAQSHLDYRFLGTLRTAISMLQVIPAMVLAYLTHNPLILIIWASFVSVVQFGLYVWHTRKRYSLGFNFADASIARIREMAAFTGKTFANLFVGGVFGTVDRMLLGRYASAADFSHYTVAANVGARIQGLSGALMGPVFCNTSRVADHASRPAEIYNESFRLVFEACVHAVLWALVWQQTLLKLWLRDALATGVLPLFVPLVAACSLNAISSVSAAQLGPLNRAGAQVILQVIAVGLTAAGVFLGWKWGGITGAAYGYLASRVGVVLQDLYVIRLIRGGGWLAGSTWVLLGVYGLIALAFFGISRVLPVGSPAAVVLALVHAAVLPAHLLYRSNLFRGEARAAEPMQNS
jgi:O-antigen/teichoic acid export membrane protein